MKAVAYLILIVAIMIGVAPWGVGMLVEKRYKQMLDQVSKVYEGDLVFTVQYTRGYFTSTAKTDAKFVDTGEVITVVDTIHNGPVIFSGYMPKLFKLAVIESKLVGPTQEMINAVYGGKQAYNITTTIEFSGAGTTVVDIMPLKTDDGYTTFNWQGGQYVANFNSDLTMFDWKFDIPSVDLTEQSSSLMISNITGSYSSNVLTQDKSFKVTVADISVMDGDVSIFQIKEIMLHGVGVVKNELLDGELTYSVSALNTDTDQYGPINLNIKIKNLDVDKADEISNAMSVEDDTEKQRFELLSKGPVFDVIFNAATPQGRVDLITHLEAGGPSLQDGSDEAILNSVKMTTDFKIAKQLVDLALTHYVSEQVAMAEQEYFMVNRDNANAAPNPYVMSETELKAYTENWITTFTDYLVANNYVTVVDVDYVTKIQMDGKVVTVNGQERTSDTLTELENKMMVNIEPQSEIQQPPAPTVAPSEPTPPEGQLQTPPSQLQPMTEGEAQQKLDSVQTMPQPAM